MSKGRRYVTTYKKTQCYGGPEEGGWWYDVYVAVGTKKYSSNKVAEQVAQKFNDSPDRDFEDRHERSVALVESKKTLHKSDTSNKPRPRYE